MGDVVDFCPYLGFGYRYLVNDGSKVDEAAYKRVSQYYYMPIGTKISKSFSSGFSITLTGEFDWLIAGEQSSRIGDLIYQMSGGEVETDYVHNYQRKGWGARFGLKVDIPITKKIGLFVEPYYRMWKIQNSGWGESDTTHSGSTYWYWYDLPFTEPFNTTRERGIRAGIYF